MKVKQRLGINNVVTIITVFLILFVLFLGLNEIKKAVRASSIANELITSAFERSAFKSDYLRTGNERAKKQWFAKHEQIGRILKSAAVILQDPQDKKTLQNLIKDHENTINIFSDIVKSREMPKPDASSAALAQEKEDRLGAQLEMRLYNKILLARTLRESADSHLLSVLTLAGLGIICGLAILIAAAIINSWTMGRTIMDHIRRLHYGASIIGGGNLDYKIEVKGYDEFVDLSDAFNAMSARLQSSYQDLEEEIETRKRAEKELALRMEETQRHAVELDAIFNVLPYIVTVFGKDGRYQRVNSALVNLFGFDPTTATREEIARRVQSRFTDGQSLTPENMPSSRALKGETVNEVEYLITNERGEERMLLVNAVPLKLGDDIYGAVLSQVDITERKHAQEALLKAHDELEERVHQRTKELKDAITAIETEREQVNELNETLEQRVMERTSELQAANESLRASRMAALNLMEDALAARMKAEEAEARLRLHTENSPTAIVEWNADFIVTRWAGEAEQIFGWSAAETVGRPIMDLNMIHEEDIPIVEQAIGRLTDGVSRKVVSGNRNYTKDGRVIHCEWYNSVLYDAEGKMTSVMSQILDITERKRAELALQTAMQRFFTVLSNMYPAILLVTDDGRAEFANQAFCDYFGLETTPADLIGLEGPDIIVKIKNAYLHPDEAVARIREIIDQGQPVKGEEIDMQGGGACLRDYVPLKIQEQPYGRLWIHYDITDRKRMEIAIQENIDRLHRAHEASHSGTWGWDMKTNENFWSEEIWNLYGLEPHSVEPSYEAWQQIVHPDDRRGAERVVQKAVQEGTELNVEFRVKSLDGTEHWLMSRAQPLRDSHGQVVRYTGIVMDITERRMMEENNLKLVAIVESSDDAIIGKTVDGIIMSWNKGAEQVYGYSKDEVIGKPISMLVPPGLEDDTEQILERIKGGDLIEHFETLRMRKDGRPIPVSLSISAIHDAEGKVIGASTIARDISEQKRTEEEVFNLLAELERSNKDLEQFAYVASHDLQEPLRMVSSYTQLLAKRYKDKLDQDAKDYIEYAANGANRMQRLIKDLLLYSRATTRGATPVPVDLKVVLGEALGNLQVAIKESGAVVTNDDLPVVTADHTQLVQVLQNLIGNAVKFQKESAPRIHISAEKTGMAWRIAVQDNGIGIDPQYFERIFVIFQRLHTADKYQGTGIGLALCKRIIQRLGGNMWVESEPGKGSTFYFTLKGVEE